MFFSWLNPWLIRISFDSDDIGTEEITVFFGVLVSIVIIMVIISAIIKRVQDDDVASQEICTGTGTVLEAPRTSEIGYPAVSFVVIEMSDGSRHRFQVKRDSIFAVGDSGRIRWQGNRIISFDRNIKTKSAAMPPKMPEKTRTDLVVCPKCGVSQYASRTTCWQCRTALHETKNTAQEQQKKPVNDATCQETAPMVFCSNCGTKQPYGSGKCTNCSTELVKPKVPAQVFCYQCGQKQSGDRDVCSNCGTKLVKP